MEKLKTKIAVRVAIILLLAILFAFSLANGHHELTVILLLLVLYASYSLYKLNIKAVDHFKIFIDNIKYSGNTLSVNNTIAEQEYEAYYEALGDATKLVNQLSQERETNITFYNSLLNRIDFGLIVANQKEEVVWINNFALNILNKNKLTHLDAMPIEFNLVFKSLTHKSSKILKIERHGRMRSLVINFSLLKIRGDNMHIYSFKDMQLVVDEIEGVAWKQLVGVLTHEIMNSLAPIISLAETFSGEEHEPQQTNKAMETINRRSKGLVNFISNYKKLAQIPKASLNPLSVNDLLEGVQNLMLGEKTPLKVLVSSQNLFIHGDRVQLEQVLINLIKNAREACSTVPNPLIQLSAMENEYKGAVICVSDNGSGIEPDVLEKIFTPFYSTKADGSGIGLSICRQIIANHGGTLTATSVVGNGSAFYIVI